MNRCTQLDDSDNRTNPVKFRGHRLMTFSLMDQRYDASTTRGQYLALIKAWLSCFIF